MIIACTEPVKQHYIANPTDQTDPVHLTLVVNTHISMVLRDYYINNQQIDRMEMTRRLLKEVVTKFQGERIALVVLGNPPSLWLPLTNDRKLVLNSIKRLKTTLGGRTSDIGTALQLVEQSIPAIASKQNRILLFSDGYQLSSATDPIAAAASLAQKGFTIDTVSVGSLQKPDFSLGKSHLIYHPVNLAIMEQLAQAGKGKMFHAQQLGVTDKLIKNQIDSGLQRDTNQKMVIQTPLYQYPLILILILLSLVWMKPLWV